jgi:peptidoglycan/LPS O-acetylase OafA/YrhL
MISGYLYRSAKPLGWADVARRLRRILPPYLVASVVVLTLMPERAPTWSAAAVALISADAIPIYYYVFLLVFCVATLPIVSRMSRLALQILVGALVTAVAAACVFPSLVFTLDRFWSMRNPIESFALGYFLLGWIAAIPADSTRRWSETPRMTAILLAASAWPLCVLAGFPYPLVLLAKIPYALAVWTVAWRLLESRPAPATVRLLSDSSYGVFLYHYLAQEPLRTALGGWPTGVKMGLLIVAGLGGALLFGALLRRTIGRDSAREWFGFQRVTGSR